MTDRKRKPRPDRRRPIALEPLEGRVALSDVGDLVIEITDSTQPPPVVPLNILGPQSPLDQIDIGN